MDEEGFPLPQVHARLIPDCMLQHYKPENTVTHHDEESGETTRQHVVVVRKPPETDDSLSELELQLQCLIDYEVLNSQTLHSVYLNYVLTNTGLQTGYSPLPLHKECHSDSLEAAYYPTKVPPDLPNIPVKRQPFRIPSTPSPVKVNRREVYVSIRQEFCRGDLVYDDTPMDWKELRKKCNILTPLRNLLGHYFDLLPPTLIWILQVIAVILKCCYVPRLGLNIVYYHFLYNHVKIHLTGEARGIEPVFTGAVYQGPLIYSIRAISCPYCRQKRQSQTLLRYFESLQEERKMTAVR